MAVRRTQLAKSYDHDSSAKRSSKVEVGSAALGAATSLIPQLTYTAPESLGSSSSSWKIGINPQRQIGGQVSVQGLGGRGEIHVESVAGSGGSEICNLGGVSQTRLTHAHCRCLLREPRPRVKPSAAGQRRRRSAYGSVITLGDEWEAWEGRSCLRRLTRREFSASQSFPVYIPSPTTFTAPSLLPLPTTSNASLTSKISPTCTLVFMACSSANGTRHFGTGSWLLPSRASSPHS